MRAILDCPLAPFFPISAASSRRATPKPDIRWRPKLKEAKTMIVLLTLAYGAVLVILKIAHAEYREPRVMK